MKKKTVQRKNTLIPKEWNGIVIIIIILGFVFVFVVMKLSGQKISATSILLYQQFRLRKIKERNQSRINYYNKMNKLLKEIKVSFYSLTSDKTFGLNIDEINKSNDDMNYVIYIGS